MTEKGLGPPTVQLSQYIASSQLFLKLLFKSEVFQLILTYLVEGSVSSIAVKGQSSGTASVFTLVLGEHSVVLALKPSWMCLPSAVRRCGEGYLACAENTPETTLLAGSLQLLAVSVFVFLGSAAHP